MLQGGDGPLPRVPSRVLSLVHFHSGLAGGQSRLGSWEQCSGKAGEVAVAGAGAPALAPYSLRAPLNLWGWARQAYPPPVSSSSCLPLSLCAIAARTPFHLPPTPRPWTMGRPGPTQAGGQWELV